jgi:hypothetical protein
VEAAAEKPARPAPDSPAVAVVTATRLNVRQGPGLAFPVAGQLGRGESVIVRRVEAGWCEIDYPETLAVWMARRLVSAVSDPSAAAPGSPVRGVVARSGARLRASPSLRGVVLGERQRGDELSVIGASGDWYGVLPPPDLRVYVHADHVEIGRAAVPGEVIEKLQLAERLLREEASLEEAERALRLLEEALATEGLSDAARRELRARAGRAVARVPPSRWLFYLERAREARDARLLAIDRRYEGPLEEARAELEDLPRVGFTATGVVRPPAAGSARHRLVHSSGVGEALLYELAAGGADLSPFVGKAVGIVGEEREPERPGGPAWIEVRYVEEIAGEE